jgi:sec-independent protein translocase protein TatB
MFGMGFMEIFLILIVAIMALGPEKLPSAAVDMVKFFKKIKGSINDAKETIDNELNIKQMKEDADKFKASFHDVKGMTSLDMHDLTSIDDLDDAKVEKKVLQEPKKEEKIIAQDVVTQKQSKKENISYNNKDNIDV